MVIYNMLINTEKPRDVIDAVEKLDCDHRECNRLAAASSRLNQTIFNPERLQKIFVSEMEKVVEKSKKICVKN
jgi:hypothetical protein